MLLFEYLEDLRAIMCAHSLSTIWCIIDPHCICLWLWYIWLHRSMVWFLGFMCCVMTQIHCVHFCGYSLAFDSWNHSVLCWKPCLVFLFWAWVYLPRGWSIYDGLTFHYRFLSEFFSHSFPCPIAIFIVKCFSHQFLFWLHTSGGIYYSIIFHPLRSLVAYLTCQLETLPFTLVTEFCNSVTPYSLERSDEPFIITFCTSS